MDYYYALLESYEQLKRRKFKLSLREEEGVGDKDPASVIKDLGTGKTRENPGSQNGVNVYDAHAKTAAADKPEDAPEEEPEEGAEAPVKPPETFIGVWAKGGPAATLMKGGDVNPKDSEKAQQMIDALMGGEGEEGQTGNKNPPKVDSIAQRINDLGFSIRDKIMSILDREKTAKSDAFPGLERGVSHTRRPESLANVARGTTQGFTGEIHDLPVKIANSDNVTPEEKEKALEGLGETMEVLDLIHQRGWTDPSQILAEAPEGMTETEARQLGAVLSRMKVTDNGILIDGVCFFYRRDSSIKTDALRNAAEQLDKAAKIYNSQFKNPEDMEVNPTIPELSTEPPKPSKNGGREESYRGPVAEKFMRISGIIIKAEAAYEKETDPKKKQQILEDSWDAMYEVYEDAMNDGSYERLIKVFGVGRSVLLGEKLATLEGLENADYTAAVREILAEDLGMDEAKVDEMIRIAGDERDNKNVMMAIILTTLVNQNMDRELFGDDPDLVPDDISHAGDTDATSSGQKADLVFTWEAGKCEQVKKAYEKKLGSKQKKVDGKCGSQEGVGIDDLLTTDEDGSCRMEVELKTLTTADSSQGAGELSPSRSTSICDDAKVFEGEDGTGMVTNPKTGKKMGAYEYEVLVNKLDPAAGMSPATKKFADRNKERMDGCLGEGASDRACAQHKKLAEMTQRFTKLLTPGTDGVTLDQMDLMLDSWWSQKQQDEDGKARYEAARRALREEGKAAFITVESSKNYDPADGPPEPPQPTPEEEAAAKEYKKDLAQLKKVKNDLQQLVFKQELHRTSSGPGFSMVPNPDAEGTAEQPTSIAKAGEETGKITDPDWGDYLAMNYSQACGTTEETFRVTRGVEDGYQSVYLNNATVEENLRKLGASPPEAHFEYEQGGTIINLVDSSTGEVLAKNDTARGQSKWTVPSSQKQQISDPTEKQKRKAAKKAAKGERGKAEENIMLAFLQGQHALLEKLIAQTT